MSALPSWLNQLLPILVLLAAVGVVLLRLPKVELGHSAAFKRRRFWNWFPLGLTYAFLYFGRYNLSAIVPTLEAQGLMNKAQFGIIDGAGAVAYFLGFLINGPLTDRWGGRVTILISAAGASVSNALMGLLVWYALAGNVSGENLLWGLGGLMCLNMYFQSFGAVSIVKVNAPWFHVRERGVLGGVFGILISLGLYFSYDWTRLIVKELPLQWAFFIPAAVLVVFFLLDLGVIRDSPQDAGFKDFDTQDASSGDTGPSLGLTAVVRKMFASPVIPIIVAVEFCSGFLRNAVMKWYLPYASAVGEKADFVASNWGVLLCVAGIMGGVFAGFISDHVFDSRRGPVSAVLYGGLTLGAIVGLFALGSPGLGWAVVFMSLCVIGVHGMLSGTASMDFGGRKNAGVVTGIIDGFVYAGTAAQSLVLGFVLPQGDAATNPANWRVWFFAMLPVAAGGLVLATRVWNAKPQPKAVPAVATLPVVEDVEGTPIPPATRTAGR